MNLVFSEHCLAVCELIFRPYFWRNYLVFMWSNLGQKNPSKSTIKIEFKLVREKSLIAWDFVTFGTEIKILLT